MIANNPTNHSMSFLPLCGNNSRPVASIRAFYDVSRRGRLDEREKKGTPDTIGDAPLAQ
ncbi:MAG: hypothetical protein OTI36_12130 [Beijerinckiaceae bacterium]|nr:hypothetical protein [Beijerinckiaceae bacterium]